MKKQKKMYIRGIPVTLEDKTYTIVINKPLENRFSISDKLYETIAKGYTVVVKLPKDIITITKKTKVLFTEEVESKFDNGEPWKRYWFSAIGKNQPEWLLF